MKGSFSKQASEVEIVAQLDQIPTLPTIAYELSKIINNPMSSIRDVEKVMVNDQGLTARVLRLANSSYYAVPGGCATLARAITYLGFDTVHELVLSMSILKTLRLVTGETSVDVKQLWVHAVGVAVAAEEIASFTNYKQPSDLFTCGLLHDIGKVAQLVIDPQTVVKIASRAKLEDLSYFQSEERENVRTHANVGFILAKKWNLPPQIQASIRWHHEFDPTKRIPILPENNRVVDITILANNMITARKFGKNWHNQISAPPPEVISRLGLTESSLLILNKKVDEALKTADGFLSIVMQELNRG